MRLLVAEDDGALRSVLGRGLAKHGYVVDPTDRGDEALLLLDVNHYAAAIIDWRMPGVEGTEVIRRVRGRGDLTPILMLTARDLSADRIEGLDAGADDYLVKPFDFGELLARLRALLRRPPLASGPILRIAELSDRIASRAWMPALTTTSSNPSTSASCWRGSAPCSVALPWRPGQSCELPSCLLTHRHTRCVPATALSL